MKDPTREDPRIVAAAERQMRAWVHSQEVGEQSLRRFDSAQGVKIGPYVTISREAGAAGSEIAERVGQRLGWEVLDRNILLRMAERLHTSKEMLRAVDETAGNWAYDLMATWIDRDLIAPEKYLAHLMRLVLAAARRGKVVFVGRAVGFFLPREGGPAVRLVADADFRRRRVMEQEHLDAATADRHIQRVDQERAQFVWRHFHRDVADPHGYDLVLNVSRLGIDKAVELIAGLLSKG